MNYDSIFDGTPVSLEELLYAREARVRRQRALSRFGSPILSFTLNVPGRVKFSPTFAALHNLGIWKIERALEGCPIHGRVVTRENTGAEYLAAVDADAAWLKSVAVSIEESSPLARLFDIDVLDSSGTKLEREAPRGCLLCDKPARICARSRAHGEDEIRQRIAELIDGELAALEGERIRLEAVRALIDEVSLTPKPGLVDRNNSGSHEDMDISSFIASAEAISPYFGECFDIGVATSHLAPEATFPYLREAGLRADAAMLAATGGVNTHKGAIYSFGVVIGAYGRLFNKYGYFGSRELLSEAGRVCLPSAVSDLDGASGRTHGESLYLRCGLRGIRGEAMRGFPSVSEIALPILGECDRPSGGYQVQIKALLSLIAAVEDTTLYARGGREGAEWAMDYARRILLSGDLSPSVIDAMDREFISRRLSPGGSADLFALALFISRIIPKI